MKKISGYEDLDAMAYSSIILPNGNNEKSIIKSLEPMEIIIKKSRKETKITLSNRVAEYIETIDIKNLIIELKSLIKEIKKL